MWNKEYLLFNMHCLGKMGSANYTQFGLIKLHGNIAQLTGTFSSVNVPRETELITFLVHGSCEMQLIIFQSTFIQERREAYHEGKVHFLLQYILSQTPPSYSKPGLLITWITLWSWQELWQLERISLKKCGTNMWRLLSTLKFLLKILKISMKQMHALNWSLDLKSRKVVLVTILESLELNFEDDSRLLS